jgi:hypothetical protein
LQDTANLIVERHAERIKRSDAQKRTRVLADIEAVLVERSALELLPNSEPA